MQAAPGIIGLGLHVYPGALKAYIQSMLLAHITPDYLRTRVYAAPGAKSIISAQLESHRHTHTPGGGALNFFSGRGVRPGFPKCGACELTLASEKGGL